MWLIIAVVLVVVFVLRLSFDGVTTNAAVARIEEQKRELEAWDEKYTNLDLETNIKKFMDNPDNQKIIWKEVSAALEQMPHWRGEPEWEFSYEYIDYSRNDYKWQRELIGKHRSIAVDIFLANRGKLKHLSDRYVHIKSGSFQQKYQDYELAEWIQRTLAKQGINLKLFYIWKPPYERFAWEGSRYCEDNNGVNGVVEFKEFNRSLLTTTTSIPKAYYEK